MKYYAVEIPTTADRIGLIDGGGASGCCMARAISGVATPQFLVVPSIRCGTGDSPGRRWRQNFRPLSRASLCGAISLASIAPS